MWAGQWLFEDYSENWAASEWDFSDGGTATGRTVTHQFASLGNYEVKLISTSVQGCKDTTSQIISVTTALDEVWQKASIYPNPTDKEIFIKGLTNFEWKLQNSLGILLLRGREEKINTQNLPAGLYYLTIILPEGKEHTWKIVRK
jgi:PKD repeat protein